MRLVRYRLRINELLELAELVADDLDFDGWKILANKQGPDRY